ncbi:MAG: hypothetical protein A3E78_13360 [Alphaproteobacteria bacterium RIFCSPHIGHO2_12_FULL_63_12]|nr:MAG: hypothetical protein A3E78_13360 [Alphaproteobacteria bacterium RIFCSPHIGHO2_12_FULL_63_12]
MNDVVPHLGALPCLGPSARLLEYFQPLLDEKAAQEAPIVETPSLPAHEAPTVPGFYSGGFTAAPEFAFDVYDPAQVEMLKCDALVADAHGVVLGQQDSDRVTEFDLDKRIKPLTPKAGEPVCLPPRDYDMSDPRFAEKELARYELFLKLNSGYLAKVKEAEVAKAAALPPAPLTEAWKQHIKDLRKDVADNPAKGPMSYWVNRWKLEQAALLEAYEKETDFKKADALWDRFWLIENGWKELHQWVIVNSLSVGTGVVTAASALRLRPSTPMAPRVTWRPTMPKVRLPKASPGATPVTAPLPKIPPPAGWRYATPAEIAQPDPGQAKWIWNNRTIIRESPYAAMPREGANIGPTLPPLVVEPPPVRPPPPPGWGRPMGPTRPPVAPSVRSLPRGFRYATEAERIAAETAGHAQRFWSPTGNPRDMRVIVPTGQPARPVTPAAPPVRPTAPVPTGFRPMTAAEKSAIEPSLLSKRFITRPDGSWEFQNVHGVRMTADGTLFIKQGWTVTTPGGRIVPQPLPPPPVRPPVSTAGRPAPPTGWRYAEPGEVDIDARRRLWSSTGDPRDMRTIVPVETPVRPIVPSASPLPPVRQVLPPGQRFLTPAERAQAPSVRPQPPAGWRYATPEETVLITGPESRGLWFKHNLARFDAEGRLLVRPSTPREILPWGRPAAPPAGWRYAEPGEVDIDARRRLWSPTGDPRNMRTIVPETAPRSPSDTSSRTMTPEEMKKIRVLRPRFEIPTGPPRGWRFADPGEPNAEVQWYWGNQRVFPTAPGSPTGSGLTKTPNLPPSKVDLTPKRPLTWEEYNAAKPPGRKGDTTVFEPEETSPLNGLGLFGLKGLRRA